MTPLDKLRKLSLELYQDIGTKKRWIHVLLEHVYKTGGVYLVGGCVRDAFLDKPIKDVDIVVDGLSLEEIIQELECFGKVDIVGESFSVIKFKPIGHVGEPFDIAVPRVDRKVGEGHKGFKIETEGVTLLDDLKRRDFTINSMAYNIFEHELIDPFNGQKDLEDKIIRATDSTAFIEDPLRILRGIQFAARFGFDVDFDTLELMRKNAHLIKEITGERIFEEFEKVIKKQGSTFATFRLLRMTCIDVHLFGTTIDTVGKRDLDEITFWFILGLCSIDDSPADFLKNRLKADNKLVKAVATLDSILIKMHSAFEDDDLRLMLSKEFTKAPEVMTSKLLPEEVKEVVKLMDLGFIPKNFGDVAITGDTIMEMTGAKGPDVGLWIELLLREALTNKFDWKSVKTCKEHLIQLME